MKDIGKKILYHFFGLETKILETETQYNNKSNATYIAFPIIFSIVFFSTLFLTIDKLLYNKHWAIISFISLVPFLVFYTLLSFSFISWRYGKDRENKWSNIFTLILRSSIQLIILLFISSILTVIIFNDFGVNEIKQKKETILSTFIQIETQKNNEILSPLLETKNNIIKQLNNDIEYLTKENLRKVEEQYYKNQILKLTKSKDSIEAILELKTNNLLSIAEKNKLKYLKDLESNSFYFISLKNALESKRFYFIASVFIIIMILFNISYYKRFLSEESDYYNIDMLLQEKLIAQEGEPIIEHTKGFLKNKFNYNYNPPLNEVEIKKLLSKKTPFKDKSSLIEKLKNGN